MLFLEVFGQAVMNILGRGVAPGVYTKIRDFKGDSVSKGV
jgi:hypothetical protein